MSVIKKPDLTDPKLRAKLAKGMGHNYYGEPAWPNDLLYVFPVCILGTFACCIGLAVMAPTQLGEPAVPLGLITVPFIENVNKFQNPFRRPIASLVFIVGFIFALWFGIGACLPIDKAVSLGFF